MSADTKGELPIEVEEAIGKYALKFGQREISHDDFKRAAELRSAILAYVAATRAQAFAAGEASEREACAWTCDQVAELAAHAGRADESIGAVTCATYIRARAATKEANRD